MLDFCSNLCRVLADTKPRQRMSSSMAGSVETGCSLGLTHSVKVNVYRNRLRDRLSWKNVFHSANLSMRVYKYFIIFDKI